MLIRTSRRSFLTGLGLGAAALVSPFVEGAARADGGLKAPLRLLVIQTPDGRPGYLWRPTGSATQFTFASTMQPFQALAQDLVVVDGVEHRPGGGEPHCQSMQQWMTGSAGVTTNNYTDARAPSVDQVIAQNAGFVGSTRYKSLQLAGDNTTYTTDVSHKYLSWAGQGQPLAGEYRPLANFKRLFDGVDLSPAALQRQLLERRSVLDVLKKDWTRMSAQVPASQRANFDAHLAAIRALETSLAAGATTCKAPDASGYPAIDADITKTLPQFWKANSEILRLALACDMSRVVTFMSAPTTSHMVHNAWAPGMSVQQDHHGSTHNDVQPNLAAINLWYSQRIAELITSLKTTPDPAGGMLLDNMLVVYGSEFGSDGVHSTSNIPFVLFGKAGGALRTGRYLKLAAPRSSNDLWVSVFKMLGMPRASFGDPAKCQGEIPGLA